MSNLIGFFWVIVAVMYVFDILMPTQLGTILMCLLLAVYSFLDKK